MDFLRDLKDMSLKMYVSENYIDGNIDKFIKNLEISDKEKKLDLSEIFLEKEKESTKKYLKNVADISRRLELICEIFSTRKLEKNRKDLIKIGAEMLKIAQEIIDMGDGKNE